MTSFCGHYKAYVARGNGAEMFKSCLMARGCWKLLNAEDGDDTTGWDLWYGNNGQACPFKRLRPGVPLVRKGTVTFLGAVVSSCCASARSSGKVLALPDYTNNCFESAHGLLSGVHIATHCCVHVCAAQANHHSACRPGHRLQETAGRAPASES